MQVSVEITSGLERRLVIGVPAERVESEVAARLQKAAQTVRLKGFRPGKVPVKIVRQRFGAGVRMEVLGDVMSESFREAVTMESLRPAGQPKIEPKNVAEGQDLEFVATFEVFPELDLVDFTRLRIKCPESEVTEDDVEKMIANLRHQSAAWEPVEREARDGDRLKVSFDGTRDGEPFAGGSAEDVDVVLGSERLVAGFETGLIGSKSGETVHLSVTMPEDYHVEELRSAAVEFVVEVKEVAEQVEPEINEEFFARFGVAEGGEDAFRAEVRSNMERQLKRGLNEKRKSRVFDALLDQCEVTLPNALVDQEIHSLREQALRRYGEAAKDIDPKVLPDDLFREQAERRVAVGLLIGEIIERNELKADATRIRAMIEEMASSYEDPDEVVNWYYRNQSQLSGIEAAVLEEQAVECVLERAEIETELMSYEQVLAPDPKPTDDATAEPSE